MAVASMIFNEGEFYEGETEGLFDDIVGTVSSVVAPVTKVASSVVGGATKAATGILGKVGLGGVAKGLTGLVAPALKAAEKAVSYVPGVGAPIAAGVSAAAALADKGHLDRADIVRATKNALPALARPAFDQAVRALNGQRISIPGAIPGLSGEAMKAVRALANNPKTRSMSMRKLANLVQTRPENAQRAASHLIKHVFALPDGDWLEVGEFDSFDTGAVKARLKKGTLKRRTRYHMPKIRVKASFVHNLMKRSKKIDYAFKKHGLDPVVHGKKQARVAKSKGKRFDTQGYWETGAMDLPTFTDPGLPGGSSANSQFKTASGKPVPAGFVQPNQHHVQSGETSFLIAQKYTADGNRWRELRDYNPDVVSFSAITTNDVFTLPPSWVVDSGALLGGGGGFPMPGDMPGGTLPGGFPMPGGPGAAPLPATSYQTASGKPMPAGFSPPLQHRVQSGEYATLIGKKYTGSDTRWKELKPLNDQIADWNVLTTSDILNLPPTWVKSQGAQIPTPGTGGGTQPKLPGVPTPGSGGTGGTDVVGSPQQVILVQGMMAYFYDKHREADNGEDIRFGTIPQDIDGNWSNRDTLAMRGFQRWYNNNKSGSLRTDGVPDSASIDALKNVNAADMAADQGKAKPPMPGTGGGTQPGTKPSTPGGGFNPFDWINNPPNVPIPTGPGANAPGPSTPMPGLPVPGYKGDPYAPQPTQPQQQSNMGPLLLAAGLAAALMM